MEMKEVEYTQYKEFLCAKDAEVLEPGRNSQFGLN